MDYSKLFIDGQWVNPSDSQVIEVENPATKKIIAAVPAGNQEDVNKAVEAAAKAQSDWAKVPVQQRKAILQKALDILQGKFDEMVDLEMKELGSPLQWTQRAHIKGSLKRFEHYLKSVDDFEFKVDLKRSTLIKEPMGVVACITPWNYPLGQIVQKIIPAMLTGNTVVFKPSQQTPLTSYILCQAFQEAGLPSGVLNMVTGRGSQVGNALATHPLVDMVSFTGSTVGGKEVGKLAMDSVKRVALELGGKSPMVVLEGADYEMAIAAAMESVFYNTGQTCAALTRVLAPKKHQEEIEAFARKHYSNYKVGSPEDPSVNIGPLASAKQFEKVKQYMELGVQEGAKLLLGEVPTEAVEGYYVQPAVFSQVTGDMTIAKEEIFGPVISILYYDTLEEAIALANDTIYGLSGAVMGPSWEEAEAVAAQIKTGDLYINEGRWDPDAPFGGYKQSGIGREGGLYGLEEFVQIKTLYNKK